MNNNKIKLNSGIALVIALINTTLLFSFLLEISGREDSRIIFFGLFWLVTTVQLGLITYFDTSNKKKMFKILSIISLIITVVSFILIYLLFSYARGFRI